MNNNRKSFNVGNEQEADGSTYGNLVGREREVDESPIYEGSRDEVGYEIEETMEAPEPVMDLPYSNLREINIKPLSSGFLVNVGCQSVAVETVETLVSNLTAYLNNPMGFEKAWYSKKTQNKL